MRPLFIYRIYPIWRKNGFISLILRGFEEKYDSHYYEIKKIVKKILHLVFGYCKRFCKYNLVNNYIIKIISDAQLAGAQSDGTLNILI